MSKTLQEIAQQQVNINLNRQIEAQARALAGVPSSIPPLAGGTIPEGNVGAMRILAQERNEAIQALNEAQELVKEWQSAMEAWRDLAQTLRDEIKACPNHEAHKFGKDDKARAARKIETENKARVSLGLKPHSTQ
jgi:hypothetical protein